MKIFVACLASFASNISSARAENISSNGADGLLLRKVMEGLPRYDGTPKTAETAALKIEVEPGITHLAPRIIKGFKTSPKFNEFDLLTENAREAAIRKQYGSPFQYAEEKRIRETIRLRVYANNLKLAGDHLEGAAIQKEIDRLLVARNSDWKSQDIDRAFNARYR